MVTAVPYPNCCGANVLQGFAGAEDDVLRSFVGCVIASDNRRKLTFVLNEGQVERYPRVLAEAHRMGFVLGASWINSVHNSKLFEFQRCGERIRLNAAAEQIAWPGRVLLPNMGGEAFGDRNALIPNQDAANNRHIRLGGAPAVTWVIVGDYVRRTALAGIGGVTNEHVPIGSVGTVTLVRGGSVHVRWRDTVHGNMDYTVSQEGLERVRVRGEAAVRLPYTPIRDGIQAGSRVTVNSPTSRYHGTQQVVERIIDGGHNRNRIAIIANYEGRVSVNNLRLIPGEAAVDPWERLDWRGAPEAAPEVYIPPMTEIHLEGEEQQWLPQQVVVQAAAPAPPPPPPVPAPTVVYTAFHAHYRDGRLGAGYDSLDLLTVANPRVRRYVRRDHMSIGAPRTSAVLEVNP